MKRLFLLCLLCLLVGCGGMSPEAKRLKEINPEAYDKLMSMPVAEMEMFVAANAMSGPDGREMVLAAARRQGKDEAEIEVLIESMDLMNQVIRQELKKKGK